MGRFNGVHTEKKAGTGAAITINCGFKPKWVRILNAEGLCTLDWNDAMEDASGYKIKTGIDATADTVSLHTFISSGGVTPLDYGFTIGTDSDVNVNGEDLYITAGE